MLEPTAVTTQPGKGSQGDQVYVSPAGVTVRTMTADDCHFAGRLFVEGFRDKFVHTVGERKGNCEMREVKQLNLRQFQQMDFICLGQPPEVFQLKRFRRFGFICLDIAVRAAGDDHRLMAFNFHRIFIAEVDGERAGAMEIKFHGDREGPMSSTWRELSCWPGCRLRCMYCTVDEEVERGVCYLDHIAVDEGFRGRGVGKALMMVADKQARARQCHNIYLWVASDNRAKNLYSREGYRITGNRFFLWPGLLHDRQTDI